MEPEKGITDFCQRQQRAAGEVQKTIFAEENDFFRLFSSAICVKICLL